MSAALTKANKNRRTNGRSDMVGRKRSRRRASRGQRVRMAKTSHPRLPLSLDDDINGAMADTSCGNTDEDLMPKRQKMYDKEKVCARCKSRAGHLVIRHAVYCKECFIPAFTLKFRRILQPTINPKKKGKGNLLIAHSGGIGSSVLLHLLHRCFFSPQEIDEVTGKPKGGADHPRHVKVWKAAKVAYVDLSSAFPEVSILYLRDRRKSLIFPRCGIEPTI
jgi:hypothetical protein